MRVLVAGAEGFIGRHIVVALKAAGHDVVAGVRRLATGSSQSIGCDFSRDLDPNVWIPRLSGVDVVVNAIGILRPSQANSFERVHVLGPKALFEACVTARVWRVIQISALGSSAAGEYLASKHRGDAELAKLDLDWTILRPSLVYSVSGSYGGTSLLRAMAAFPGVIIVPGSGEQQIQPIRAEDLGLAVVGLIEKGTGIHDIISAIGPERVTLLDYLHTLRRWLEFPTPVVIRIPTHLAHCGAWFGEHFSNGPVGLTMWRMLQEGNVGSPGSGQNLASVTGVYPQSVGRAHGTAASFVQDRWHARLYFLGPLLRVALAILWIASAIVGFFTPLSYSQALFVSADMSSALVAPLVSIASAVDLSLGILALIAWQPAVVATLMCASLVIYMAFIGTVFPWVWMEPFGGLLKNLPLIPAVLVMGVLSRRR
jgi:uncharacterized protein YbjT (DUF2867 family)